jgi:ribonuclease HI
MYSAAVSTEETATFMLLLSLNKGMTTNLYASLCRKYPHMCKFLGTIPSDQLQYAKVPFWNSIQIPLSKHPWELQIIAIWNTKGRVCLNAHNKDWLKELAKEIPEAMWEIQNIHNHPYQSALGSGQHSGLNKFNKLPNDYPQALEGPDKTSALMSIDQPHNCNIDESPQNSSSQNLTCKVKDWRDWTYTDGSFQMNEVGQDTGSGVYHPHLNVSHYVNLKGMGITNTISRAELAAIAAAVIHGYTHIATDSLTSLHQIKKQLSHPNLLRHHIQGDVLQSIAKAIRQSPSPIHFYKVKSHAGIIGNEHTDALAKKSATTYADIADTSIRTAGLREIPSTTSTGLQKKT